MTEKAGAIIKPAGDECRIYETGSVRWKSLLHLQSIGLLKAVFIQKRKDNWYLTEEGEQARKLSPGGEVSGADLLRGGNGKVISEFKH